jgi:hypothetical protein
MEPAHAGLAYAGFPSCRPTRPGRSLSNFFEEPEDRTTTSPTPETVPQAATCPPGYLPADLNGDGTIESCVEAQAPA